MPPPRRARARARCLFGVAGRQAHEDVLERGALRGELEQRPASVRPPGGRSPRADRRPERIRATKRPERSVGPCRSASARIPRTPSICCERLGHAGGCGGELDGHRDLPLQALAQLVGAAFGDDPPAVEDQHPSAEQLHLGQDVGREQQRVLAAELPDQLADGDDLLRIEPDGRLVENQHLRVVQDRPGEADALAVTFGERADDLASHIARAGSARAPRPGAAGSRRGPSPRAGRGRLRYSSTRISG